MGQFLPALAETPAHAIFKCPRVADLWAHSECEAMCNLDDLPTMCDLVASWRAIDKKVKSKGAFLAWVIWGERNSLVFNDKATPNKLLLDRAERLAHEHGHYVNNIYPISSRRSCSSPKQWVAPSSGVIKLNADASLTVDGW